MTLEPIQCLCDKCKFNKPNECTRTMKLELIEAYRTLEISSDSTVYEVLKQVDRLYSRRTTTRELKTQYAKAYGVIYDEWIRTNRVS